MIVNYFRAKGDIRTIEILEGTVNKPLRIVRDGLIYDRIEYVSKDNRYIDDGARCSKCSFGEGQKRCAPGHACSVGSSVLVYNDETKTVERAGVVPTAHYWVEGRNNLVQRIDVVEVEI